MPLDPQETLYLIDGHSRCLGRVDIERIEGNRVFAQFTPGPEFDVVRPLFGEFEEVVNDQIFSLADKLSGDIDRLGLRLGSADGSEWLALSDVQISNGDQLTCRVPNLALTQVPEVAVPAG